MSEQSTLDLDIAPTRRARQIQKVKAHLVLHGSITRFEAYKFGCQRLAARIGELKGEGWPIEREMIAHPDGRHAKYNLIGWVRS